MEQQTVIFLGPQGCGKGTQVGLLKNYIQHTDPSRAQVLFEAGNRLREFGKEGGYAQDKVNTSLAHGSLQPDFITLYLMAKVFFGELHGNEHLFVDGFPRTRAQQDIFNGAMEFYERKLIRVVYITLSDEEAVRRLLLRGRNDDTEEGIRRRLAWSRERAAPAIEWFRAHPSYQFFEIQGERTIEEIHADIVQQLALA